MCLVKRLVHKENYSKPFVAENDILVYKALDHSDTFGNKKICTPYVYYPITFINGKCVMETKMEKKKQKFVEVGVHAFTSEEKIRITCMMFPETKMTKHWAIIPKGSEYFIGREDDIVSNKLIIFRTREDFRKYKKEHECSKLKFA